MSDEALATSVADIRHRERLNELKTFLRICSGGLSMPLFLLFFIADIFYAPEQKWTFLGLRLLMIPVCLLTSTMVKKSKDDQHIQKVGTFYTAFNSFIITYMIFATEGVSSPYYAGLNLVSGILSFVPWTKKFLAINSAIVYGPYFLIGAFTFHMDQLRPAIINLFFMAGTFIVCFVIRHFSEKLREQDASSKFLLQQEMQNRGKIIERQTQEAVQLKDLTKQFSPQIVHAIQNGNLDIWKPIQETHICAIFIDIVNSTEKVVNIDKVKLQKVISLFIHDTMSILLKYDITLDKFMGDGILAFSNNPMKQSNYITRVLRAATEIIDRIEENRSHYLEHWGSEFQIKIGVAEGIANVGFYGEDKTLKSYTAIGKVINLACRLCSAAEDNGIFISESVQEKMDHKIFMSRSMGKTQLKGFAEDGVNVFQIVKDNSTRSETTVHNCPDGHGILHLDVSDAGIFIFKCRSCDYILNNSSDNDDNNSSLAA